jgi:saxitoxin biosynthesis operon SxtJ-like protein
MKGPANPERSFGLSVGTVLLIVGALAVWRGRVLTAEITGGIGVVLVTLGRLRPSLLRWPSALWWRFALLLGYVNARIILSLAFALVLVPLGLMWRLLGRDPLGRRRGGWSGWSPHPARYRDRSHFSRMY